MYGNFSGEKDKRAVTLDCHFTTLWIVADGFALNI